MDQLDATVAMMTPEHRRLYARHIEGQRKGIPKSQKMATPAEGAAGVIEQALTVGRPPGPVCGGDRTEDHGIGGPGGADPRHGPGAGHDGRGPPQTLTWRRRKVATCDGVTVRPRSEASPAS